MSWNWWPWVGRGQMQHLKPEANICASYNSICLQRWCFISGLCGLPIVLSLLTSLLERYGHHLIMRNGSAVCDTILGKDTMSSNNCHNIYTICYISFPIRNIFCIVAKNLHQFICWQHSVFRFFKSTVHIRHKIKAVAIKRNKYNEEMADSSKWECLKVMKYKWVVV